MSDSSDNNKTVIDSLDQTLEALQIVIHVVPAPLTFSTGTENVGSLLRIDTC